MKVLFLAVVAALILVGCSEDKQASSNVENMQEVVPKQIDEKVEVNVETKVEAPVEETKAQEVEVKEESKVAVAARTGESIFKACTACHGINAEKSALGKSQIIKGWDADKISAALNGYKDGTYGGAMKGIMKGQSSSLTPDEIKLVSEYISKL